MLNRWASLAISTSVLKALSGKLDIKGHSPSNLYLYHLTNPSYTIMVHYQYKCALPMLSYLLADKMHKRALLKTPMIWRILGESLMISSLPGKDLRTLVDIARLSRYREY